MRLLALDCSAELRSVALGAAGELRSECHEAGARRHAERLVPLAEATLAEAGWAWSSIDRLAVAVGPGSFTGVRIAVATVRALALALDRPVHGVTTLAALASATDEPKASVVPVLNARRGGLYVAWPTDAGGWSAPEVATADAAADRAPSSFTAVGSGAEALVAAAGRGRARSLDVTAAAVLAAAQQARNAGTAALPGPAVHPLYVRGPDAVPHAA